MSQSVQPPPSSLLDAIKAHWLRVSPREAVGLILPDNSIVPLRNLSPKQDSFIVGFWSILWKLGLGALRHGDGIKGIYHTHISTAEPSQTDMIAMDQIAQRWPHVLHLIYVPDVEWSVWQNNPHGFADTD